MNADTSYAQKGEINIKSVFATADVVENEARLCCPLERQLCYV